MTFRGVQIEKTLVDGKLDLHFAKMAFPLAFRECIFVKGGIYDAKDSWPAVNMLKIDDLTYYQLHEQIGTERVWFASSSRPRLRVKFGHSFDDKQGASWPGIRAMFASA